LGGGKSKAQIFKIQVNPNGKGKQKQQLSLQQKTKRIHGRQQKNNDKSRCVYVEILAE